MSPRYSNVTSSISGVLGMIIRYASHNVRFIDSTNTKNFKECPKVSTGESTKTCANPYA